jgi:hypothetical protein
MSAITKLRSRLDADHAEVRIQRGERIVGDLRRCRRHGANEGRLAGVREAEQADVREQLELQLQQALLALGDPWWPCAARGSPNS